MLPSIFLSLSSSLLGAATEKEPEEAPVVEDKPRADICLLLEGTYPYVAGGVSSWVHEILRELSPRTFSLAHIAPHPGAYTAPRYELPDNVLELTEVFCRGEGAEAEPPRRGMFSRGKRKSRTLRALGRLHLGEVVDDELIADLAANDITMQELLHGEQAFKLIREIYDRLAVGSPFMDFFWHFRAMHVPMFRILQAQVPRAKVYHAVSTGYAGLLSSVAAHREGCPMLLTEHGIYAREREMELARAKWIKDMPGRDARTVLPSPLRKFWSHYFVMLSRISYHQSDEVITLSETNRRKQLRDGADPKKTRVIPNGVDLDSYKVVSMHRAGDSEPVRIGFVGRIVPIKDVITLIKSCSLALERSDFEVWLVGPQDEDPAYVARCKALVATLSLEDKVKFLGPQKVVEIYPQLDILLLTSLSEGQPLVMLEGHAAGLPVISTDVGACRELIEGRDPEDAALGHSGIVTKVASPPTIAAAMVRLANDRALREQMGKVGLKRVTKNYDVVDVLEIYDALYGDKVSSSPE